LPVTVTARYVCPPFVAAPIPSMPRLPRLCEFRCDQPARRGRRGEPVDVTGRPWTRDHHWQQGSAKTGISLAAIRPDDRRDHRVARSCGGDLRVNEVVITYDGAPSYAVSVMEFSGDLVAHETQYFADPSQRPLGGTGREDPRQRALAGPVSLPAGSRCRGRPVGAGPPARRRRMRGPGRRGPRRSAPSRRSGRG
jgi:hypothetical protein